MKYIFSAILVLVLFRSSEVWAVDIENIRCSNNSYHDETQVRADSGDPIAAACFASAEIMNYTDETINDAEHRRLRISALRYYSIAKKAGITFRGIIVYGKTWSQLLYDGDNIRAARQRNDEATEGYNRFARCRARLLSACGGDVQCANNSNWQCSGR